MDDKDPKPKLSPDVDPDLHPELIPLYEAMNSAVSPAAYEFDHKEIQKSAVIDLLNGVAWVKEEQGRFGKNRENEATINGLTGELDRMGYPVSDYIDSIDFANLEMLVEDMIAKKEARNAAKTQS